MIIKVSSLQTGQPCDLQAEEVLWPEDGECYVVGERGPCQPGQTLKMSNSGPGCVEEEEEDEKEKEDECHKSRQVRVEGSVGCHSLLTRGPCEAEDDWVVLEPSSLTGRCERRRCEGREVWLASHCGCLGPQEAAAHCGQQAGLVWSPLGEGICVCEEDSIADQAGVCHQLGSRGPCRQHQVWLLSDNQTEGGARCADNDNQDRFIELLSSKSNRGNRGDSNTAQGQRCYVDEAGRCRKILNIANRFGQEPLLAWPGWLAGFTASSSLCSPGGLEPCQGEEGQEGVRWSDGECYQLATTGPCPSGHWLVLDQDPGHNHGYSPQCQQRVCSEEEVLWSPSCSCFPLQTNETLRLKADLITPCQDGERLVVSPYGEGFCYKELNGR